MKKLVCIFFSLASLLILFSCSSDESGNGVGGNTDRSAGKINAYSLGEMHASQIIRSRDNEDAVQALLLEVRARKTNIEYNRGKKAAKEYERGFLDYLHKNCDSLARVID